jgi:hypothetical protein
MHKIINQNGFQGKVQKIKILLRKYNSLKISIVNMEQKLTDLYNDKSSLGAVNYDKPSISPTFAFNSATENECIDIIESREDLESKIKNNKSIVERLERSLSCLNETELIIIKCQFIDRMPYYTITYKIYRSESRTKVIAKGALNKLVTAYYGDME